MKKRIIVWFFKEIAVEHFELLAFVMAIMIFLTAEKATGLIMLKLIMLNVIISLAALIYRIIKVIKKYRRINNGVCIIVVCEPDQEEPSDEKNSECPKAEKE